LIQLYFWHLSHLTSLPPFLTLLYIYTLEQFEFIPKYPTHNYFYFLLSISERMDDRNLEKSDRINRDTIDRFRNLKKEKKFTVFKICFKSFCFILERRRDEVESKIKERTRLQSFFFVLSTSSPRPFSSFIIISIKDIPPSTRLISTISPRSL